MLQWITEIPELDAKVSVFGQNQVNKYPHYPKGFTWHIIERKHIKYDDYSSLIMWTWENSRYKYWVVSQQAIFFNAFLAMHDDFNDARIKVKNWNTKRASWSIWLAHLSLTHFLCIGILWAKNLWEKESTSIGRQNKHNFKTFNT
jgi:hypothetical protein